MQTVTGLYAVMLQREMIAVCWDEKDLVDFTAGGTYNYLYGGTDYM
jgi:hypothetical protein